MADAVVAWLGLVAANLAAAARTAWLIEVQDVAWHDTSKC